jgi:lysozyme family protein
MVDITALKRANAARWGVMRLRPERKAEITKVADRLVAAKKRYVAIESLLKAKGFFVPWWVIAVIHEREAGKRWDCQLAQGDLWKLSTHDPGGRGPFFGATAFERGCLDALIDCAPHAAKWKDWSTGGTLTLLEEYNGLGYAARGVPSAYVWSGSNQYTSGKYVADHVYRASAVDVQEGCAPIIKIMMGLDSSIAFTDSVASKPPTLLQRLWSFLKRFM